MMVEISTKVLAPYIEKAGQSIKNMVSSSDKQKLLPKIIKRSGGIKAAKARPLPFYKDSSSSSDVVGGFVLSHKQKFVLNQYRDKLIQAISKDNSRFRNPSYVSPEGLIAGFARHDPSGKHEDYLNFMARMYSAEKFKIEDIPRIENELDKFTKIKHQLPNKDIDSYKDLEQLYDAVDSVEPKLSKNMSMELAKKAGTVVLVNEPDFKLLQLKNMGAVKQYCSGTRWCFSSDYDTFKEYSGGLYLILARINGEVRKLAFHRSSGQFMNEKDIHIIERAEEGSKPFKQLVNELAKFPGFQKALQLYFGKGIDAQLRIKNLLRISGDIHTRDKELEDLFAKQLNLVNTGKSDEDDILDDILFSYVQDTKQPVSSALENEMYKWATKNQHAGYLLQYAVFAKKKLPLDMEKMLLNDGGWDFMKYVDGVVKGPVPELEHIIFDKDSNYWPNRRVNGHEYAFAIDLRETLKYLLKWAKKRAPTDFEPFLFTKIPPSSMTPETRTELRNYRIAYAKKYLRQDTRTWARNWIANHKRYF